MRTVLAGLLSYLLPFCASATLLAPPASPNVGGRWAGNLRLPSGTQLTLIVNIKDNNAGRRTATLDVPTQNAQGVLVDRVDVRADSVLLTASQIKASFAGRLTGDGRQIDGRWQQNGAKLPLVFQRATSTTTAGPKRPQEPAPPFPYREEQVRFASKDPGVQLAGTLTLPTGAGPFPAVVLLSGSGAQDRDESIFGHHPFRVVADYLTRRGIAVLRFDDRGVGQSGGNATTATAADYAKDAQGALAFLRSRPGLNPKQLGLIGHSEGGTAAIAAAGQAQGPAFLVLLATPGVPGIDVLSRQAMDQARLKTKDPKVLASTEQRQRNMLMIVQQTQNNVQAQQQIIKVLTPSVALPPDMAEQIHKAAEAQAVMATSPAFRHILADNPQKTLPAVKCPVLALNGSKDLQVASAVNLPAIEKTLKGSGNRDVTTQELAGLNHMFQTASTGATTEYGQIEETFSPIALQSIGDWLTQRTKR
ncbi:alpha/beta hydrolase family protein [Hymenobacter crusticola]|uniref:alpha/beta hydrolase family protein n=1 Tax=Hymenobacter crusticola TaxID=1770526 RepID=UPI000A3C6374|nr:alpha/beta hydrolase [Hymenobacter crusticola]